MLLRLLCLLFMTGFFGACGSPSSATDSATPAQQTAEDYTLLFDGSVPSADNWRGYNQDSFPTRGWRVENGQLIVEYSGTEEEGYGGDLITKKKYKDFDLLVDFMLSDTSNSGILYLVQEIDDTPIWHSAPEYQLLDDATYLETMDLKPNQLSGANYGLHEQRVNYSLPIGEWNTARIVKRGNDVEHYLNDSLVVAYTLHDEDWQRRFEESKFVDYPSYASVDEGHIGLQDHGHQVRFRNIRIREL